VAGSGSKPLVEIVRRNDPDVKEKLKKMKPAVSSDPKMVSERGYQFVQRGLHKEVTVEPPTISKKYCMCMFLTDVVVR